MSKFKLSSSWKSLLLNKLFDLFIVICGVTIAFQLNNLKQESDQESLEQFYLDNLGGDIEKDINNINYILDELRSDSSSTSNYLSGNFGVKTSLDTLGRAVVSVLSFPTFSDRNDNTYSTLMNSHGLSVISSKNNRTLISEYYKCYKSIDRFESVYTAFLLNDFNLQFSPYVDYSTKSVVNAAVEKDPRTRNSLLIAREQLNDGISTYKKALAKAISLRRVLQNP